MGRDREHRMTELVLDQMGERRQPERGVDHEITVAAPHVPHVAAQQRVHMQAR